MLELQTDKEAIPMAAMVTVLVAAAGLVVLGVREVREIRFRRAGRRRLRLLQEDTEMWAMRERIRGVMS